MNGIIEITLKGEKVRLKFNNYAREELAKYFVPKDKIGLSQAELQEEIVNKWNDNKLLLMKNIVYAGIVGQAYIHDNTTPYTMDEIGEYIADAPYEEIFPIWETFLKSSEISVSKEDAEDVKKK